MNSIPRGMMVAIGLAMLSLTVGGFWFYLDQQQLVRRETETVLQAIAQLKVNQIADWRSAQIRRSAALTESPFFIDAVAQWLAEPKADLAEKLLKRFRSMQQLHQCRDVMLVDREGQVRLSVGNRTGPLEQDAAYSLAVAFQERKPVLTDLQTGPGDLPARVDVVAPLFSAETDRNDPLGAVIIRLDARQFLHPLIEFWPTPSRSAETLVVRKEGDSVLFLNDLRHMPGSGLRLQIPLTRTEVPAVMAVLGREGIVRGKDYRGVEVFSVLKAIPDSPWFMVAKMDIDEALAVWKYRSVFIIALVLAIMVSLMTAVGLIWERNAKVNYSTLYQAEAALRRIEERNRITLTSIGDGVLSIDLDGRVEFMNRVAEELTGWKQAEALGKPVEEVFRIIDQRTRRPVVNPVRRALEEGVVVALANHTVLIARHGTERPIADSGAPIRDQDGAVSGAVLVFRDQTEERAGQERLLAEKERAQQYLDVAGSMILVLDTHGNVVLVNRKGCEILGCAEQEILGKNWFEHFLSARVRHQVKAGFARIIDGQGDHDGYAENAVLTRNGEERVIAWHTSVLRDPDLSIVATLSSGVDITERKHYEEALRQSENLLKRSQQIAHVGSWDLDLEANRLVWSDEVFRIFGLQPQEFEATYEGFLAVVHPEDRAAVDAAYFESVREGRNGYEIRHRIIRRHSGEIRHVHEKCDHVRDSSGRIVRSVGMVQDITGIKAAEEEQKLLTEEMKNFTYIVSHDLRAPLTNIRAFSRELELSLDVLRPVLEKTIPALSEVERQQAASALNDDLPESLQFIESSINQMGRLIERVMQLSRVGRMRLAFQAIDMNELTESVLDTFAHEIADKQATADVHALPETIADRTAMEQIMSNLIGNALKYRDDDRPLAIQVTGHRTLNQTVLVVRDTGTGMDKQDIDRIFQVFQRAHKGDVPGEGMGLAYVRTLVRRHGGRIWCESEPGVGSTFTFTISSHLLDHRP
ncbi:MAG: PAS domain S-box protein [Thermodesulfobacteriota bacterium]